MKILFAASECAPFVKTGGLADVASALPKAIKELNKDIRVILPLYKRIKDKYMLNYLGYTMIKLGNKEVYCGILNYVYDSITYYFIDCNDYFYHDQIYGHNNDGERFTYFNFAIMESLKIIDFIPDIIHLNDWQTGLIPYLIKAKYQYEYGYIKTLYSIHNLQYQGNFPKNMHTIMNVNYSSVLEFDNQINFMKAAIMDSNIINTVSQTYKEEILTDYFGYGLNHMLGLRYYDLYGIVNGIDTNVFDPKTDKHIYENFDSSNFVEKKALNKEKLQSSLGLPKHKGMLVGFVSRLVEQKGIDLLKYALEEVICKEDIQVILMGSGDYDYEQYFNYLAYQYPDKVRVYIGYNEDLAQKIYAASDLFLMPSKFEPCGLGQLIALRYGCIPLVRETGGLKDTIRPYNEYTQEGNGFSFTNYNAHELKDVFFYTLKIYQNQNAWQKIVFNALNSDYSWKNSAQKYLDLYNKLTN